jgi:hypothetical protein
VLALRRACDSGRDDPLAPSKERLTRCTVLGREVASIGGRKRNPWVENAGSLDISHVFSSVLPGLAGHTASDSIRSRSSLSAPRWRRPADRLCARKSCVARARQGQLISPGYVGNGKIKAPVHRRGDERDAAAQAIEQGDRHPRRVYSPANVLLRQFAAASGKMKPV